MEHMAATAFNQRTIDEFHAKQGRGVGAWGDHLLLMTSKGAVSGQEHTTPLVYRRRGNEYVVVASKGGAPADPRWYQNVQVNPVVDLEVALPGGGTEHLAATARRLQSGPERDRLYVWMAEVWPGFLDYEKRTSRTIPIVILDRQA